MAVVSWAALAPLEGVKSRKRAVFEASEVKVGTSKGPCLISKVSLTLSSRIAAIGDAGRAVVDVLRGVAQPEVGHCRRQEGLVVLTLDPQELATFGDDLVAAIGEKLAADRAHVLILDKDQWMCQRAWARSFAQILRSDAFRLFRGAIVVCAQEEYRLLSLTSSEHWAVVEGILRQESCMDVMDDCANDDANTEGLMEQALSIKTCNLEHWVKQARDEGKNIALFSVAGEGGSRDLCGFICYHLISARSELKIDFIFVPEDLRGKSYGKRLMRWVLEKASHMPEDECRWISLMAVDERVPFYEHFGFIDMGSADTKEEELTWMERPNVTTVVDAH